MGPSYRIVVVETDFSRRESVTQALRASGHAVAAESASCAEVSEALFGPPPDMVFAGLELIGRPDAEHLRTLCCDLSVPIVALSPANHCDCDGFISAAPVFSYLAYPLRADSIPLAIAIAKHRAQERRALAAEALQAHCQLRERKVVERAKGLLMLFHHLDEATAFHKLQQTARRQGKRLGEVAETIIAFHDALRQSASPADAHKCD